MGECECREEKEKARELGDTEMRAEGDSAKCVCPNERLAP